jgi:hypothetical protein
MHTLAVAVWRSEVIALEDERSWLDDLAREAGRIDARMISRH